TMDVAAEAAECLPQRLTRRLRLEVPQRHVDDAGSPLDVARQPTTATPQFREQTLRVAWVFTDDRFFDIALDQSGAGLHGVVAQAADVAKPLEAIVGTESQHEMRA